MGKISLRFCKLQILQAKLLAVQFFILLVPVPTYGYVCNVPNEWFRGLNNTRAHTANGALWPNGVVKYTLHSSLSNRDRVTIWKAFTEFHEKTCIRFQPRQNGDPDFTEILTDDDHCGLANICRRGGYQFTKFGQRCRNVEAMIHELGHTLCLYHEQQRKDRDEYLSFQGCPKEEIIPIIEDDEDPSTLGLYDYASQMHYQCGFCKGGWPRSPAVTKCGGDTTLGLSLLDADNLNRIYNCQGNHPNEWMLSLRIVR
ncbi:unnamed protein product [Orchesella dallaii]|uniref:Metalloendopeptidase n=1 Tax=Orchesella dallaii TaxID=48710 RepID=A0ABP1RZ65_9HEXA